MNMKNETKRANKEGEGLSIESVIPFFAGRNDR